MRRAILHDTSSALPPLAKGGRGIYDSRAQGKRHKIPLNPPFAKGEGRGAAAWGGSRFYWRL
jgi:hypothetical protein